MTMRVEVMKRALLIRIGDIIEGPDGNYHEITGLQQNWHGVYVRSVSGDLFKYGEHARVLVVGRVESVVHH